MCAEMYNLWSRLVGRIKLIPENKKIFFSVQLYFLNKAAKKIHYLF